MTSDINSTHAQALPGSLSMEPGLSSIKRRAPYRDRPIDYDPHEMKQPQLVPAQTEMTPN